MSSLDLRFEALSTRHAPGQEVRRSRSAADDTRGGSLPGRPVDFSHGDVNADAFEPAPGSRAAFSEGVRRGGEQAYTEYRGAAELRHMLADRLARFTGRPVSGEDELIITPGTQGALFLAAATTIAAGDRVAIVLPDYFANRKLVEFLGGQVVPIPLDYLGASGRAGIDLTRLEDAFEAGVRTFLFSNPNNPTGVVYSADEVGSIARLASHYGVTVVVDQLYSRLRYPGTDYVHVCDARIDMERVLTIMGPSKTESLSGYRLGVAFGDARLIERMESLQAIVSLRAPGYSQAVLRTWFAEPEGWLDERVARHRAIRDDLLAVLRGTPGLRLRTPEAGSYLFPRLPKLDLSIHDFVRVLRAGACVTVTPGPEFCPDAVDSVRLNFSQNHAAAVDAVERMRVMIDRYAA